MTHLKTAVTYNREARSWQAINGDVVDFGPGKAGQRQALLAALRHDQPTLHTLLTEVARRHNNDPALLDRLLRGAQLLAKGHVYATLHPDQYRVRSQHSSEVYTVAFSGIPKAYHCTCPDFDHGQQRQAGLRPTGGANLDFNPWPVCKHILACYLAWLSEWPLESEPIPL